MDNESAVIRQQMDETRAALSEKLEMLENQVVGTVQEATTSVQETVETVKDAVEDTVHTVRESVRETVEAVKDTFDLQQQVQRHPWIMIAGATTLGFLSARLLQGHGPGNGSTRRELGITTGLQS